MLLTLHKWHAHETMDSSSSGHEVLFVGQDYFNTTITTAVHRSPILFLQPLSRLPHKVWNYRSPRRRRQRPQQQQRCSSPSSTSTTQNKDAVIEEYYTKTNEPSPMTSCSISLNDIEMATILPITHCVRLLLSSSSEPPPPMGETHYDVLEIDCLTRNAVDLLGATLQTRLPSTRWQQPTVPHVPFYNNEDENHSQSSAVPSISPFIVGIRHERQGV